VKRIIYSVIMITATISCGILPTPARGDADDAKPAAKAKAPEEPKITRDTNGNVVVEIEAEAQKQAGLKIEALAATQLAPETKAYGRVLDPAPLAALMTELATDQAASSASSNELARLKTLSTSGNASARALQAAEATALHDQLLAESARDRLVLSWGKEIAGQNDFPSFIQSLTTLDTVLIRVDLPAGQRLSAPPTAARVVSLAGNSTDAQVLGAALSVDPQTQGQGFILQITTNQSRFLPGEAVTGYLKIPGEPLSGVIVPRDAIIRTEGRGWVYVVTDEDHFTRKEIALDRSVESGWFMTSGVAAGDHVVTVGAQSLFSEETKPSGPPAD
jgi:hypothetical protein